MHIRIRAIYLIVVTVLIVWALPTLMHRPPMLLPCVLLLLVKTRVWGLGLGRLFGGLCIFCGLGVMRLIHNIGSWSKGSVSVNVTVAPTQRPDVKVYIALRSLPHSLRRSCQTPFFPPPSGGAGRGRRRLRQGLGGRAPHPTACLIFSTSFALVISSAPTSPIGTGLIWIWAHRVLSYSLMRAGRCGRGQ
jgi:hypothetical protein